MFTEQDLYNIYKNHVKLPPSYFKKFEIVPKCPVNSYNFQWGNRDFPRVWCILDFIEWIEKHNIKNIQHLGYTCNSDAELEFINSAEKTLLEYPKYDLHTISKHFNEHFDFFLFIQTI